MSRKINTRLKDLGIELPAAAAPIANYVPYVVAGNLVFVAGQICRIAGRMEYAGKVGKDLSEEEGRAAARVCALNVLAVLKSACDGDLDRVKRCVRLGVYVNSADSFAAQPQVANGASDLVVEVFGDNGKHARAAVGCNSLPANAAVEVEGVFELK